MSVLIGYLSIEQSCPQSRAVSISGSGHPRSTGVSPQYDSSMGTTGVSPNRHRGRLSAYPHATQHRSILDTQQGLSYHRHQGVSSTAHTTHPARQSGTAYQGTPTSTPMSLFLIGAVPRHLSWRVDRALGVTLAQCALVDRRQQIRHSAPEGTCERCQCPMLDFLCPSLL
jgi:hypothetical protein